MHIIHLASELAPISKEGGLADVIHGLSKEHLKQGHKVEVILPRYDTIDYHLLKDLKVCYRDLWSYDGAYRFNNTIWSCKVDGIPTFLIEPHHPRYFFNRGSIYGCDDDLDRFLYFSRAAMEFLYKSGKSPDILHLHDWPVSIAPVLLKDMYQSLGMPPIRTVLTLHNLAHQGKCLSKHLTQIGLKGEDYLEPDKLQDPKEFHCLNLLKGGIEYSDIITTVSPSYKEEIQTPQGGYGLEGTLRKHQRKLSGILNGIDEEFWNPAKDPYLTDHFPASPPFSSPKIRKIDEKKAECKRRLQKRLSLAEKDTPLVACISRLVPQKSPELIAHTFRKVIQLGGQCVILGSTHSPEIKQFIASLASEQESISQGAVILDYDESLSHLIYAASDMLVVPSLFEPCGLTQMIALRYGTVPVVRSTGGLKDTIFDWDTSALPSRDRNGFAFNNPNEQELDQALDRAFKLFVDHKKWLQLRKQGMTHDHSWRSSAQKYISVYSSKD